MKRNVAELAVDGVTDVRTAVRTVIAGGLVSTLVLGAGPAFCQEAGAKPAEPRGALEEVVVTAQRREQSLQEVPVSVSAFTSNEISLRGATTLADLAPATPNLSYNDSPYGQYLRIRGIGNNDTHSFYDMGVGIYVDGVYLPARWGNALDLVAIERVEVLRGPQGTLFGRNTIGGAINITSKRPETSFAGYAEVTTGSYDRLDATISLEGPIVPDVLVGGISGVVRNRDGYATLNDFATGREIGKQGGQDRYALRGALEWKARDDVDVLLTASMSSAEDETGYFRLIKTYPTALVNVNNAVSNPDYNDQFLTSTSYTSYSTAISPILSSHPNRVTTDGHLLTLNIDWKLDGATFKSITSYADSDIEDQIDLDVSPLTMFEQDVKEQATYVSQELQLGGVSLNERLTWVGGLFYGSEHIRSDFKTLLFQDSFYNVLKNDISANLKYWISNWTGAAYGQVTYKLTDKLNTTAGLRYTSDHKYLARERRRVNPPYAVYLPYGEKDESWAEPSGRLGFEYQVTPDVMTYVSASRGYKGGGIAGTSATSSDFVAFDPETVWTYELGVRSDWLDRRLRLNASVFYSDYQGMQFRAGQIRPDGTFDTYIGNVAAAEMKGAELELVAAPSEALRLSASVGYLDAKYTDLNPTLPFQIDDKIPDTPEWSVNIVGDYTWRFAGDAKILARIEYGWYDEQARTLNNIPGLTQPAYSMVNARLSFTSASGRWEAALFGTNLTDEEVMTFGGDQTTTMNIIAAYAAPRQWGASVKYSF